MARSNYTAAAGGYSPGQVVHGRLLRGAGGSHLGVDTALGIAPEATAIVVHGELRKVKASLKVAPKIGKDQVPCPGCSTTPPS